MDAMFKSSGQIVALSDDNNEDADLGTYARGYQAGILRLFMTTRTVFKATLDGGNTV
jgi:hypothetical protein